MARRLIGIVIGAVPVGWAMPSAGAVISVAEVMRVTAPSGRSCRSSEASALQAALGSPVCASAGARLAATSAIDPINRETRCIAPPMDVSMRLRVLAAPTRVDRSQNCNVDAFLASPGPQRANLGGGLDKRRHTGG